MKTHGCLLFAQSKSNFTIHALHIQARRLNHWIWIQGKVKCPQLFKLSCIVVKQVENQQGWGCRVPFKPGYSFLHKSSGLLLLQPILPLLQGSEASGGVPAKVLSTQRCFLCCGCKNTAWQSGAHQWGCSNAKDTAASQGEIGFFTCRYLQSIPNVCAALVPYIYRQA